MSETLIPCPFCGRAPEVTERADWHTSTKRICFVVCMCGGYTAHAHQHGDTREQAITAWNTRAKPAQSPSGEGVSEAVVRALLDAAFNELQHDTGPQDKEYVFLRGALERRFREVLINRRRRPPASSQKVHVTPEK